MTNADLDRMEQLAQAATPGPWEVQTGCSWRRLGAHGRDGNIIRPTNHPKDNHPDLCGENLDNDIAFAAAARSFVPAAIARIRELEAENERLRKDAERYRWLRQQHWNNKPPLAVVADPANAVKLGRDLPSLERLDAMIDAARRTGA